jgi:predicted transcriptional regulator
MKSKNLYKKCLRCNGTGKLKNKETILLTPDTRKMLAIMKRNDLNQLALAKILEISQSTVSGWFKKKSNINGKIKSVYFTLLKSRGIQ